MPPQDSVVGAGAGAGAGAAPPTGAVGAAQSPASADQSSLLKAWAGWGAMGATGMESVAHYRGEKKTKTLALQMPSVIDLLLQPN